MRYICEHLKFFGNHEDNWSSTRGDLYFLKVSKIEKVKYQKCSQNAALLVSAFKVPKRRHELTKRDIYCKGPLLAAVQQAHIFPNSQTLVNQKLKFQVADVISNFYNLKKRYGGKNPAHESLKLFVEENFEEGNELETWLPPDWSPNPRIMQYIADEKLKVWASELNTIWKTLGRRASDNAILEPDLYSFIPLPHSFVLPNTKAQELHYWESYWILKGLLICGMHISAKDLLENLLYLVKEYGYVPKGSRVYYEGRSSPPMLAMMVEVYLKHTSDFEFLRENIHILEREIMFWKENRTKVVKKDGIEYAMFHYKVDVDKPRPEAFIEDLQSGTLANTKEELNKHFVDIQSASESGWSFSTRWFGKHGHNDGNRSNIETQNMIPVDLNAFMHRNYVLLKWWYKRFGNKDKAKLYWVLSEELLTAIENVLWNEKEEIWQDYDSQYETLRNFFYLSNFTPLWTKSYRWRPERILEVVLKYLNKSNMDGYAGGIPASTEYSGEMWDFPNAWAPLQYLLIEGIEKIGTPIASEVAFHFADKFIQATVKGYSEHGTIFQSYDCLISGRYGIGFQSLEVSTSTLGVIFDFFQRWGHKFKSFDRY